MKKISDEIQKQMEEALQSRDPEQWLKQFALKDDLVLESQRNWYKRYICNPGVKKIEVVLEQCTNCNDRVVADVSVKVEIDNYEPLVADNRYWLERKEESFQITWFEKRRSLLKNIPVLELNFKAYHDKEKSGMLCKGREYEIDSGQLARSISRSIRFREANPLLEMALLMSNMMSKRSYDIAEQLHEKDPLTFLKKLYNASVDKINIKLVRSDRDNTIVSKYLAPSYGIDELVSINHYEKIEGNCSQVIAAYYAVLRKVFSAKELFQLRFGNFDLLLIKCGKRSYILSDELIEVSSKTMLRDTEVTKIFNEEFIVTNFSAFGITEKNYKVLKNDIKNVLPDIKLPNPKGYKDTELWNEHMKKAIEFENLSHSMLLTSVLKQSSQSKFLTYCKYSYQSIYVEKPEVYMMWSLQSRIVNDFMDTCTSLEELNKRVNQFNRNSIFIEEERIMTADQVIRNQTGDWKALSILYFVWFYKNIGNRCSIAWGPNKEYCILERRGEWFNVREQFFEEGKKYSKANYLICQIEE